MRFRRNGKPKHVKNLMDMMDEVHEDELEKYVENAKREMLEWIDREVMNAIHEEVDLDECMATLLGIVLEQSYMPFAVTQPIDLTDDDVMRNFKIFSHQQGHKMIELFAYITMAYMNAVHATVDTDVE